MGVFKRPDSKYWWIYFEPSGQRERTAILIGDTTAQRKDSRALALELYHTRMLALARTTHALPEPTPVPAPVPTFDTFADWYAATHVSQHAGAEREREILPRLRAAFGALPIDQITKTAVIDWRTARRQTGLIVERFGLASGSPAVWRQVHATLTQRGPLTLAEIRALCPDGTRNVCGTFRSHSAAPYFAAWAVDAGPPSAARPPPGSTTRPRAPRP